MNFIKKQHIRKIPGIGRVNEAILVGMGIETCEHIIEHATELYVNFSSNAFQFLMQSALGVYRVVHETQV
jgi:DNA polymerase kappa